MGYQKQNFVKGMTLTPNHLINIENAILNIENDADIKFLLPEPIDLSIYEGKAITCIGDSITAGVGVDGNPYPQQLGASLGVTVTNLGASGTVLCTGGSRNCNIGNLTVTSCRNRAVVTILMGINDWDQARNNATDGIFYNLGDITSTDTSCIYGAMKMWCDRIMEIKQNEECKNTKFYFMTPIITSWNHSVGSNNWDQNKTNIHGYKLRDLCQAIIDVCAIYDIPVIDLNLYSGIYYNNATDNNVNAYGGDGIHINEAGHTLVTEAILKGLAQNPTWKTNKEAQEYITKHLLEQMGIEPVYPVLT